MNRIYISPERRPKPHGKYWGFGKYETDVCYDISDYLYEYLVRNGFDVIIAPKDMLIKERAAWANKNNIDYYIAIHTNASTTNTKIEGTAFGTEMLAYQHPASIKANQYVYDELVKLYPSTRGLKNGNGYVENNSTNMVSCYCEIGFHDNGKNAKWILENKKEIAEAIAKGICSYFEREFKKKEETNEKSVTIDFDTLFSILKEKGIETITVEKKNPSTGR